MFELKQWIPFGTEVPNQFGLPLHRVLLELSVASLHLSVASFLDLLAVSWSFFIGMQVQNWDKPIARMIPRVRPGPLRLRLSSFLSPVNSKFICEGSFHQGSCCIHFGRLEIWWGSRGMIASDTSQMSEYDSSWNAKVQYRTAFQTLKHEPLCAKSKTSQVKHWYESVMHLATRCNRLISESNFMTCCVLEIKWSDLFLPSWVWISGLIRCACIIWLCFVSIVTPPKNADPIFINVLWYSSEAKRDVWSFGALESSGLWVHVVKLPCQLLPQHPSCLPTKTLSCSDFSCRRSCLGSVWWLD